jgi:hypothetical protein
MPDLIALHHQYEDRMLEGGAFDEIEAEIDARGDLDQDEKAALWLCAWARVPAARQKKTARQFTDAVAEGHRTVDDGSAQRLTAVMEIVRDHLEATKRAYGRPRSLDLTLERRIRRVAGLGRGGTASP